MPALPDNMNAGNLSPYGGHYGQYGGANYEAYNPVSGFLQGLTAGNSIIRGNQADDRTQQQFDQQQEATEQAQQDQTNTRLALAMRTRMLSNPSGWMTEFKPEEIQSVFGNNNVNLQNNAEYGHLVDPTQRNNFKQGADIFHSSLPNDQNPNFNPPGLIDGMNKMWGPAMNQYSPPGSTTRISGIVPTQNFQTDGSFHLAQITDHPDGTSELHPVTAGGSRDPNAPAKVFSVEGVMDHVRTGQALVNYLDHGDQQNGAFQGNSALNQMNDVNAAQGQPAPAAATPQPNGAGPPSQQNAQTPTNALDMVDSKLIQLGEPNAIARSQQIATNNAIVQQARNLDPNLTPEQRQSAIMQIGLQNGLGITDSANLATHLGAGANPMDVAGKAAAFVNERIGYLNSPQNAALMAQDLQKMGAPQSMVQQISELSKITDPAQFSAARDQIRTQAQTIATQIEQNTPHTGFAPNGQVYTQNKGAGGIQVGGPSYAAPGKGATAADVYGDIAKVNGEIAKISDKYQVPPQTQALIAKNPAMAAQLIPKMSEEDKAYVTSLTQQRDALNSQLQQVNAGSSGGAANSAVAAPFLVGTPAGPQRIKINKVPTAGYWDGSKFWPGRTGAPQSQPSHNRRQPRVRILRRLRSRNQQIKVR